MRSVSRGMAVVENTKKNNEKLIIMYMICYENVITVFTLPLGIL